MVADLHSKTLDGPSPIFYIFMQFLGKFGQIISWRPPLENHFMQTYINETKKEMQRTCGFYPTVFKSI